MSKRPRRNIIKLALKRHEDDDEETEYQIDEEDYNAVSEIIRNWPEDVTNLNDMLLGGAIRTDGDGRVVLFTDVLYTPGPALGKLDGLQSIRLYVREGEELPRELGQLQQLNHCTLCFHEREEMPSDLSCLHRIEHLTIWSRSLKTLPPEIGDLQSLKSLSLPKSVERLPEEFGELTALEKLVIHFENLTEIPETIQKLTKLESIVSSQCTNIQNGLYGLKSFLQHTNCKEFNIQTRLFMALPESFQMVSCTNLEILRLYVERSGGPIIDASKLVNLRELYINGMYTDVAYSLICPPNLLQLQVLNLPISTASLESLPKRLKVLHLKDCSIRQEISDKDDSSAFVMLKLPLLEDLEMNFRNLNMHLSGPHLPVLRKVDSLLMDSSLCLSGSFPCLRTLALHSNETLATLDRNLAMPMLEELQLIQHRGKKLESMEAFALRFLPFCPNLTYLKIRAESFERIAPALIDVLPKHLEKFMILSHPIQSYDFVTILPKILARCKQLVALNHEYEHLGKLSDETAIGRLLSMHIAERRLLRLQTMSLGLWPTILANGKKLFFNKHHKTPPLSGDFSSEDAVFRILQLRGQEIVTTASLVREQTQKEKECVTASKSVLLEDRGPTTSSFLTELMELHDQLCEILSSKIVEVRADGQEQSAKLYLLRNQQMKGNDAFKREMELYCALRLVCLRLCSTANNAASLSSLVVKLSTTVLQCEALVKISKDILTAAGEANDHLLVWEQQIEAFEQKEDDDDDDDNSESGDILLDISTGQLVLEEQELIKMASAPTPDEMNED